MRKTWGTLVWFAVVPALAFHVLDAAGYTRALRFIATTSWGPGNPSGMDLFWLATSLITWLWWKVFSLVFLVAALLSYLWNRIPVEKK